MTDRDSASAVVWNWRGNGDEGFVAPAASALRLKGALQACIPFLVATAFWYFGHTTAATIVASIGSVVLLSALLSPTGLFMALERGFTWLGIKLGVGIGRVMLAVIFFLFFLPFSLLFRSGRRDAMKRFYDEAASTYWEDRIKKAPEPGERTRQF